MPQGTHPTLIPEADRKEFRRRDKETQDFRKSQSGGKNARFAQGTDGKYYPATPDGKSLMGGKGIYLKKKQSK